MNDIDFVRTIRHEQRALAVTLADEFYALSNGALDLKAYAQPEPETNFTRPDEQWQVTINRDGFIVWVLEALRDYSDWLARAMFCEKRFAANVMPDASESLRTQYGDRHDTPKDFIQVVVTVLKKNDRAIPLLGDLKDGVLTPNVAAIRQWASYHNWS